MITKRHTISTTLVGLWLTSLGACASQGQNLTLDLSVTDEVVSITLTNNSERYVEAVDTYQTIDGTASGGFFFEVRTVDGKLVSYCGMLDQGATKKTRLNPHESIVFKTDMWVLRDSHCLKSGVHTVTAVYYNYLQPTKDSPAPIRSNSLKFDAAKIMGGPTRGKI